MAVASSRETRQVISEVMGGVKSAVPPYLYRCFLKVMKFAVDSLLTEFNATGIALRSLNSLEMNFSAVECETPLVCHLLYLLGYEQVDEPFYEPRHHKFAMVDVTSSKCALEAFQALAMEEISQSSTMSVADLTSIGVIIVAKKHEWYSCNGYLLHVLYIESVPLLVAHLGYNFHLRLELIGLSTAKCMIELMEEDVVAAMACVDYLTSRLGVMAEDSTTLVVWNLAKEMLTEYMSSRGSNCGVVEVREILKEVALQLSVELSFKISMELIHVFLFTNSVELAVRVTGSHDVLNLENVRTYERNFKVMPTRFLSDKFLSSCDSAVRAMTRALEGQSSPEETEEINKVVVWQSRHFIYHVRPEVVQAHHVVSQLQGFVRQERVDHSVPEQMLMNLQPSLVSGIPVASVTEIATISDEEKHKEDMNENEKVDSDSEVDNEPLSETTLSNFSVESHRESSDSHISVLERQVDCCLSLGELQNIESDIKRMCEKSSFRNSELKKDIQQLNYALSCTSNAAVVEALREGLSKSTNEYNVEGHLTLQLETVKSKLNLRRQALRSRVSVRCLPCDKLRQGLHNLLCQCSEQCVASNLELVVAVLPLFTDDEISLLHMQLAADRNISESDSDMMYRDRRKAVTDWLTELLAYLK